MRMPAAVQFIGLDELSERGIAHIKELAHHYHEKIERALNNPTSLTVHVKRYNKEGTRAKYSVHAKAVAATHVFYSTKAHDWDIARTLHKAFKDLENQIEHRLHTSDQKPKRVGRNSPNPRKRGYQML